ncbi:hypothetical protein M5689_013155 [Euphorbia peplus]|nr:hypothetical protein M5689_013155 [Euphorbia peplus]
MVFKHVDEFRVVARKHSVMKGAKLKFKPNDFHKVGVRCRGYTWYLYGSTDKRTHDFVVRSYIPSHICSKTNRNRHCNSKYIVEYFIDKIVNNPNIRIWRLQEMVKHKHKVFFEKTVCRRAKLKVIQEYIGDYKLEFSKPYDYMDELLRSNTGSTCIMHGICKGELLSVHTKDGNNQMYPIAWAVVDDESKETWKWFLRLVREDLNMDEGAGFVLVTNCRKGLIPAIAEELPEIKH